MRAPATLIVFACASACILYNPDFDDPTATSASTGSTTTTTTTTATASTTAATTTETTTTAVDSTATEPTTGDTTTAESTSTSTSTSTTGDTTGTTGDPPCEPAEPPMLAGPEIVMAAAFSGDFTTYELGPVPGIPPGDFLGGMSVHYQDSSKLLIAGAAEGPEGKIFEIEVDRGPCGHILGFVGQATVVADAANVSDLFFVSSGLLFYSEWDKNHIAQLLPGEGMWSARTDLDPLGVTPSSGGIALVPPGLAGAGELRVLSWDSGEWYHLKRTPNGQLFDLGSASLAATLPKRTSGVAYVPAGSPGFAKPTVVITENEAGVVHIYEVDDQGDPKVRNHTELFTKFADASGAYFEPVTGDLLISTLEAAQDRVFIVQGFAPPPPLQD